MTFPPWSVFWPRRTRQVRTGTVNADLLTRKGPALGRASSVCSSRRDAALGGAAQLMGVALSLLDAPGGLISRAQRYFCNALVGVDHLLQAVPYQIALRGHEVLYRAAARQAAQTVDVLRHPVLDQAQHLVGDL